MTFVLGAMTVPDSAGHKPARTWYKQNKKQDQANKANTGVSNMRKEEHVTYLYPYVLQQHITHQLTRNRLVLPQPLGPVTMTLVPGGIDKFKSRTSKRFVLATVCGEATTVAAVFATVVASSSSSSSSSPSSFILFAAPDGSGAAIVMLMNSM